ncbi:MAG: RNA methyltransferase [Bacteroidota bacterium]|nr:RNA methyltransferase [Bacteroidota bacterium]
MKAWLKDEFPAFMAALSDKPVTSIRVHPHKGTGLFSNEMQVPWCIYGKYLEKRPAFVHDPLYHAGAYYAQEASSMLLCQAANFTKPIRVLDLCAAPGGKSSLIHSFLKPGSLLVSNELVSKRTAILYENLVKWGACNIIITQNRAVDFARLEGFFDLVLVDAPCSGEGMFRKDAFCITQWSESLVNGCSDIQKELLNIAVPLLREGGRLVYSTCTFEAFENEDNVGWLYNRFPNLRPVQIPVEEKWGLLPVEIDVKGAQPQIGYYCLPHRVKGEGFFTAVLEVTDSPGGNHKGERSGSLLKHLTKSEIDVVSKFIHFKEKGLVLRFKNEEVIAFPLELEAEMNKCGNLLRIRKIGCTLGTLVRGNFIPHHDAAMSDLVSKDIPKVELNFEDAIAYQQRRLVTVPGLDFQGWLIFRYKNVNLGWAKSVSGRINNHYPKEWRIRKELGSV